MKTFTATHSTRRLVAAVVLPPLAFFLLVQFFTVGFDHGERGTGSFLLLVAVAQLLPLAALTTICFSAAAYTIGPGRLIVHRVAFDREIRLTQTTGPIRLHHDVITVHATRPLRLRVDEPARCLTALEQALAQAKNPELA
ncbi:MAG: hypothetical protein ABIZ04_20700 [Opitutus sp.]